MTVPLRWLHIALLPLLAAPAYDFREFEARVLPAYLRRFKVVGAGIGGYAGTPNATHASPFGSRAALKCYAITNQLNLTESANDEWAGFFDSFQDRTGLWANCNPLHTSPPSPSLFRCCTLVSCTDLHSWLTGSLLPQTRVMASTVPLSRATKPDKINATAPGHLISSTWPHGNLLTLIQSYNVRQSLRLLRSKPSPVTQLNINRPSCRSSTAANLAALTFGVAATSLLLCRWCSLVPAVAGITASSWIGWPLQHSSTSMPPGCYAHHYARSDAVYLAQK